MIINSEKLKQSVLIVLGDNEMLKILDVSMLLPRSVNDIIKETGIPHTTAYRKVKWLLDQGLLSVEKITITEEGKKFSLVRSTLRSFEVKYTLGDVTVEGEQNFNPADLAAQDFFSLGETTSASS
jgi:DNA-binding transcriptional ArsR family regulator